MNNSINTVNLNSKVINMNINLKSIKFEDLVQVANSWGIDLPNEGYWTGNSLSQAIQTLCWGKEYKPKDIDIFYTKATNEFEENQLNFNSYGDLKNNELDIICTERIDIPNNNIYIENVYVLWNEYTHYKGFINTFLNRNNVLNYMGVIVDLSTGSLSWNLGFENFISTKTIDIKFSNENCFSSLIKKSLNKASNEDLYLSRMINVIIRLQDKSCSIHWYITLLLDHNKVDVVEYILDNNIPFDQLRHVVRSTVIDSLTTKGLLDLEYLNSFINIFINANVNNQLDWNNLIEGIEEIQSLGDLLVSRLIDYRPTDLFLLNSVRNVVGDRYNLTPQDIYNDLLEYIITYQERNNIQSFKSDYIDYKSYNPKFKSRAGIRFYGLEIEFNTTVSEYKQSFVGDSDGNISSSGWSSINQGLYLDDIKVFMKSNKLGQVVRDSSCGYEIVSTPWEYEDLLTYIELLPLEDIITDSNCGIHIHVSRDIFTPLMLGRLLVFMNDTNNTEYIVSKVGRSANSYCQIKDKGNDPSNISLYSNDRYEAINITNFSEDKYTIEFRMFASTNCKDTIKSYVNWLDTIITLSEISDLSIDLIESHS